MDWLRRLVPGVLIGFLLVITLSGFTVGNYTFRDVEDNTWYTSGVEYVVQNGLMQGTDRLYFRPQGKVTRAQVAQILYNMDKTKVDIPLAGESSFTDVRVSSWYSKAINYVYREGYMSGYGNNKFGPDDNVTREQLAQVLYRFAGSPTIVNDDRLNSFADSESISSWAKDAMSYMVSTGIMSGNGHGLNPRGTATRAEMSIILKNFGAVENIGFDPIELEVERGTGYIDVTYNSKGSAEKSIMVQILSPGTKISGTGANISDGMTARMILPCGPTDKARIVVYSASGTPTYYTKVYEEKLVITEEDVEAAKTLSCSRYDYEGQPIIRQVVDELWDDDADVMTNMRSCYDWCDKNISYNYQRVDDTLAYYIPDYYMLLEEKQGICGDYACLLTAMLRYKGIEAYEVLAPDHGYTVAIIDGRDVYMDACWGGSRYFDFQDGINENHKELKRY